MFVLSGFDVTKRIGFMQSGQTGGRIGDPSVVLHEWHCPGSPLRVLKEWSPGRVWESVGDWERPGVHNPPLIVRSDV